MIVFYLHSYHINAGMNLSFSSVVRVNIHSNITTTVILSFRMKINISVCSSIVFALTVVSIFILILARI